MGQRDELAETKYVASVLRDIGYRPVTHLLTGGIGAYLHFIGEPSHRVQMCPTPGWIPDYPSPDAYFDFLFSCQPATQGNNNSHYCRPDVDELVAEAKSTQLTDPPEALALWERIDRRIVDDAPIVPTVNEVINVFTSTRVGNVQTIADDHLPDRPDVGEVMCPAASSSARLANATRPRRAG